MAGASVPFNAVGLQGAPPRATIHTLGLGGESVQTGGFEEFSYRQVYSRVDYPLLLSVGQGSTVTLEIGVDRHVLQWSPSPGQGVSRGDELLVTAYSMPQLVDVVVHAGTMPMENGPVVWQMTSAPEQSLLQRPPLSLATPAEVLSYKDSVQFDWMIRAVNPGQQNLVGVTFAVTLVFQDGSEDNSGTQATPVSVPILLTLSRATSIWNSRTFDGSKPRSLCRLAGGARSYPEYKTR